MNTVQGKETAGGRQQDDDNRIRPGFIALLAALLAGVVALIVIPLWHSPVKGSETVPGGAGNLQPRTLPNGGGAELFSETVAADAPMSTPSGAPPPPRQSAEILPPQPPAPPGPVEEKWGVRVSGVWLAPENKAVQMTYQVTDFSRANLLSENGSENQLIDLASGKQIPLCPSQLKDWPYSQHSKARSMALQMLEAGTFPPPPNRLVAGKTYTVLIPNPDGLMKSGSQVAVVVGGVRSSTITVR